MRARLLSERIKLCGSLAVCLLTAKIPRRSNVPLTIFLLYNALPRAVILNDTILQLRVILSLDTIGSSELPEVSGSRVKSIRIRTNDEIVFWYSTAMRFSYAVMLF